MLIVLVEMNCEIILPVGIVGSLTFNIIFWRKYAGWICARRTCSYRIFLILSSKNFLEQEIQIQRSGQIVFYRYCFINSIDLFVRTEHKKVMLMRTTVVRKDLALRGSRAIQS